jgi:hypothetical protein
MRIFETGGSVTGARKLPPPPALRWAPEFSQRENYYHRPCTAGSGGWNCATAANHCKVFGERWNPGKEKGRTLLRPFHNQHATRLSDPCFSESHHNWVHAIPSLLGRQQRPIEPVFRKQLESATRPKSSHLGNMVSHKCANEIVPLGGKLCLYGSIGTLFMPFGNRGNYGKTLYIQGSKGFFRNAETSAPLLHIDEGEILTQLFNQSNFTNFYGKSFRH